MDQYDDKTLAEALAEAMRLKGFTVSKLAEMTGVAERIIELFLAERFEDLPPSPYVHGYLLKIGESLGADGNALWNAYGKFHREIRRAGHRDTLPENRFALPKIPRKLAIGALLALLAAGLAGARLFFGGSSFMLEMNIPENLVVATSTYLLEGHARPGDQLTVNGALIVLEDDGAFAEELNLVPGFNTLRFVITRPLERARESVRKIFYQVSTTTPAAF
ncbi:MAG: helix-turn-helix domain-containing protein [Candidatus Brennerbacteria bacterium]|nr:helix-turn-helix domain-containing protein [Candidatus Brennerbacteria bacterium]